MSVLLNAQNLTKYYEKNQRPALDHVSFKVSSGEFVGIMGASGSGKTTLLNVLSTIDSPPRGASPSAGLIYKGSAAMPQPISGGTALALSFRNIFCSTA